uniref:Uncharacterized protein n=1 Tax=Anguilla anguilla TaxID=7936 RepID=A0A0E9RM80_ANGAN
MRSVQLYCHCQLNVSSFYI